MHERLMIMKHANIHIRFFERHRQRQQRQFRRMEPDRGAIDTCHNQTCRLPVTTKGRKKREAEFAAQRLNCQ